jgi:hypothetical protein
MRSVKKEIIINRCSFDIFRHKIGSKNQDLVYSQVGDWIYLSIPRKWIWEALINRVNMK